MGMISPLCQSFGVFPEHQITMQKPAIS